MAGSVVIQYFYLAQTIVQLDRYVARNQPLAILPPLATIMWFLGVHSCITLAAMATLRVLYEV